MSTAKPKPRNDKLTMVAREAIEACGLSLYDISERTGVDRGLLSRFKNGKQSITLATFDRINEVLRLRINRR